MNAAGISTAELKKADSSLQRGVLARYFNPFRLACYILVMYAFGHTSGAVVKVPHLGPESDAVVAAMRSVHVSAQWADCTWYGFYRGFGWMVTLSMLFAAFLAWRVGGMPAANRPVLMPLAWGLFLMEAAGIPLVFLYFFPAPMVFQTVIAALLGLGCLLESRRGGAERAASG